MTVVESSSFDKKLLSQIAEKLTLQIVGEIQLRLEALIDVLREEGCERCHDIDYLVENLHEGMQCTVPVGLVSHGVSLKKR